MKKYQIQLIYPLFVYSTAMKRSISCIYARDMTLQGHTGALSKLEQTDIIDMINMNNGLYQTNHTEIMLLTIAVDPESYLGKLATNWCLY